MELNHSASAAFIQKQKTKPVWLKSPDRFCELRLNQFKHQFVFTIGWTTSKVLENVDTFSMLVLAHDNIFFVWRKPSVRVVFATKRDQVFFDEQHCKISLTFSTAPSCKRTLNSHDKRSFCECCFTDSKTEKQL